MESRQLATPDDIQRVEVHCSNARCDGIIQITFSRGILQQQQECPGCGRIWWSATTASHTYRFLAALLDLRRGTWDGGADIPPRPAPSSSEQHHPPIIRLVLPGRLD